MSLSVQRRYDRIERVCGVPYDVADVLHILAPRARVNFAAAAHVLDVDVVDAIAAHWQAPALVMGSYHEPN